MTTQILERPETTQAAGEEQVLVTLTVADQLYGVPVLAVRDILGEQTITRIPLAPHEITARLNLAGSRRQRDPARRYRPLCRPAPPAATAACPARPGSHVSGRRAGQRAVRSA